MSIQDLYFDLDHTLKKHNKAIGWNAHKAFDAFATWALYHRA